MITKTTRKREMKTNRQFALLLSVLSLTACVTDKSSDAKLSGVMHHCFRTTGDAVLYQTNKCPPLDGSDTSTCITLKYLDSFSPPVTLIEFKSNSLGAAERVTEQITPPAKHALLIATPKVTSLGAVTRGTSFTVVGMRRFSHPEQGAIWITTAKIRDGEFAGQMITLPWDDLYLEFHGDGAWITDFLQREPFIRDPYRPQIDLKKMTPCTTPEKGGLIGSMVPSWFAAFAAASTAPRPARVLKVLLHAGLATSLRIPI